MTTTAPVLDNTAPDGAAPVDPAAARRHVRGFWLVGFLFATTMAFAAAPAPLYVLYAKEDHFGSFAVTAIFAAYAVGVAVALFLAGHLSDRFGRLRLIAPAVLLNIVAAVMFIGWHELGVLLAARFVSGLGIGMLTATATAHMTELYRAARPGRPTALPEGVTTAANIGGIGLGPLVAGVLAQYAPRPLLAPYVVFGILMVVGLVAVVLTVPETVERARGPWRYRPQRVGAPAGAGRAFAAAAVVAFVAFAMFGFFTSLAPSFLSGQLHLTSHALAGLLTFLVFGSAGAAQILSARLPRSALYPIGLGALAVGLVVVVVAILVGTLAGLVVGGITVGVGSGVAFKAAVGEVIRIAPAGGRGEALAGLFLIAYLGMSVPVVLLGLLLEIAPTNPSVVAFGVLMLALLALSTVMVASDRRISRRAALGVL
jgi:predicted MFS family arabinose efflux permease